MSKSDTFLFRATADGGMDFGDYNKARLKVFLKENPGKLMVIQPKYVESNRQRRFFEGAIIPLIAFYQDNMDHRNSDDLAKVREWLKMEFNADYATIAGKAHKIVKSTKGVLNEGLIETILVWMEDQGMKVELLNPEMFKHWQDTVYPYGGPDNYIDYLVEIKRL